MPTYRGRNSIQIHAIPKMDLVVDRPAVVTLSQIWKPLPILEGQVTNVPLGLSAREAASRRKAHSFPPSSLPRCPRPWVHDAGMYEPIYLAFDAYPTVVPRVRVRGVMALFLAASILWALIW